MSRISRNLVFLLFLLPFVSCVTAVPIDISMAKLDESLKKLEAGGGVSLPIDARAEIVLPVGTSEKQYTFRGAHGTWVLDEGAAIKNAGRDLFRKVFREVESTGEIHDPHITIRVKPDVSIDRYWRTYKAEVDVNILYGNGDTFGSYSASISSGTMTEHVDKAYRRAFIEVIRSMLEDPEAVKKLRAGVRDSNVRVTDKTPPVLDSRYSDIAKAVVTLIITKDDQKDSSGYEKPHGSGFFINDGGLILTNNHVVKDAAEIAVKSYEGKEYTAEVVATDIWVDLALLRVDAENTHYLQIDDKPLDYLIGEEVIAVGSPLRVGFEHSISKGIISSVRLFDGVPLLQTDAAVNPGSSGGPLIHLKSEKVIGINTLAFLGAEGVNFALTLKSIREFLKANRINY